MARGSAQATNAGTAAAGLSSQLEANAGALEGTLAPQLEAEAAHPSGFAPADLAAMNTAAQQSAGGGQAAATGQGGLLAARTRNAGAPAAAIDAAARTSGRNLSAAGLRTQEENAREKLGQQQAGLTGLERLTGMETGAGIQSAGQIAPDVNANTNAANASWDWAKYILGPAMGAAGGAISGGAFGDIGGGGGGGGALGQLGGGLPEDYINGIPATGQV